MNGLSAQLIPVHQKSETYPQGELILYTSSACMVIIYTVRHFILF